MDPAGSSQHLPPPPATWPSREGRGPSSQQGGFDYSFEVPVPERNAAFLVHVGGRAHAPSRGIILVLHGAGYTGMSWAPAAAVLKDHSCVMAVDMRGHGGTTTNCVGKEAEGVSASPNAHQEGNGTNSMSLESLTRDVVSLLATVLTRGLLTSPSYHETQGTVRCGAASECETAVENVGKRCGTDTSSGVFHVAHPETIREAKSEAIESEQADVVLARGGDRSVKILLVGHSLGGSIAVRVAGLAELVKEKCKNLAEISGVVAVDVVEGTALAALEDLPAVLRKIPTSFENIDEAIAWHLKTGAVRRTSSATMVVPSRLKEDDTRRFVWRTDLKTMERNWRGWFEGLSSAFIDLRLPKALIVAGMDRLDTKLTAAHMQGKFELKLVYGSGHSIQEDQPEETAAIILRFALRHSLLRMTTNDTTIGGTIACSDEEALRQKLARARSTMETRRAGSDEGGEDQASSSPT